MIPHDNGIQTDSSQGAAHPQGLMRQQRNPEDFITDWYLFERDIRDGFVYPGPVRIGEYPRLTDLGQRLLEICRQKTKDGYAEFVVKDSKRTYRGHRIDTVQGYVYALRRLPDKIPALESLGLDNAFKHILMDPWLSRGGLIMICGETGQGKSTTCAATVKERMLQHGSFCLTVEDPPEMPLHGIHGQGRCIQTEVKSGDFAAAMRGAMRCYPTVNGSMLYVGETRDAETAAEVLRISINGHLVLTTIHAQDVTSAIKRFVGLASSLMPADDVKSTLSSAFRVAMHQTLESQKARPGEAVKKKLRIQFLLSHDHSTAVANRIRTSGSDGLGSDIEMQKNTLMAQGHKGLLRLWK